VRDRGAYRAACRELGIAPLAVPRPTAWRLTSAWRARRCIGRRRVASYLNIDAIIRLHARSARTRFIPAMVSAENADFAAIGGAGLPSRPVGRRDRRQTRRARAIVSAAGAGGVWSRKPAGDAVALRRRRTARLSGADQGGCRWRWQGMRIVRAAGELDDAFAAAGRRGATAALVIRGSI
jgi:hypothetical protein